MFTDFDLWKLLAGLGIFIFGMFLMEESIKKLSGRAFKTLIRKYTTGKLKSIITGVLSTAILQSSSAVSLMILAFVGAVIMAMENAIGVILGSNIGTTITAWIVASVGFKLKIESFALPLIGTGGLGIIFFGKSEKYSHISKLLVGFGFLFMGLDYMKASVESFAGTFDLNTIPDYGIIVSVGIGLAMTAIMQSSSATMAIILTTSHAGIMTFESAAAMVIGANMGTTVTILLGAIGGVQVKKRVAFSHFTFNLITGVIGLVSLPLLIFIVYSIFAPQKEAVLGLALFHTMFNIVGVLAFFPFINLFAKLMVKIFPDKQTDLTIFINNTTSDVPEAAISALKEESLHLVKNVLRYNLNMLHIDERLVFSDNRYTLDSKVKKPLSLEEKYENLKLLQAEIIKFAAAIQMHELTEMESGAVNRFLHAGRMSLQSAKTLKGVKHDFDQFESADNLFLNDQYIEYRKRMIETYLKLDKLIAKLDIKNRTKTILKIMKIIKADDEHFVSLITQAITSKRLTNIDISTAMNANRAFAQSSKQVLLALKELQLSSEELKQFDTIEDISDTLLEIE